MKQQFETIVYNIVVVSRSKFSRSQLLLNLKYFELFVNLLSVVNSSLKLILKGGL